ncbi:hypothetical protein C9I57_30425 [Trinickia symbiotica]|uniref:DUF2946 domain-containing protein n=1 Tax=Trinickia symbiotica TaxID=863227 RepID=A0A2T3XKP3_9BURK|nr:DUF2946 domain-containing protein [Trinickia symbiotica]PTB17017.1 hypothetical protein C9I57_30425 [Trinickia symbiotica]
MLSRHRQKIGALLGMLAILLSMAAPTVSQVLLRAHADTERPSHHWHHAHHLAAQTPLGHAGSPTHHHGSDSSSLCDACPYCGFITHTPALPGVRVALSAAAQRTEFPPPVTTAAFRPYTVLTTAQPRAPPALS